MPTAPIIFASNLSTKMLYAVHLTKNATGPHPQPIPRRLEQSNKNVCIVHITTLITILFYSSPC
jgi:hypothetical protein